MLFLKHRRFIDERADLSFSVFEIVQLQHCPCYVSNLRIPQRLFFLGQLNFMVYKHIGS